MESTATAKCQDAAAEESVEEEALRSKKDPAEFHKKGGPVAKEKRQGRAGREPSPEFSLGN